MLGLFIIKLCLLKIKDEKIFSVGSVSLMNINFGCNQILGERNDWSSGDVEFWTLVDHFYEHKWILNALKVCMNIK